MNSKNDILIGSRALLHWYGSYANVRNAFKSDYDFIVFEKPLQRICKSDDKVTERHFWPSVTWFDSYEKNIAEPDVLYTIKVAHSFWPVHWNKTMKDILFLQSKNAKLIPELFEQLYAVWVKVHGSKDNVNLNKSPDEFFTKYVDRRVEHDELHKLIAYYDEPLHERIKRDDKTVFLSQKKFNGLSHEDKIKLCREEIHVIALERYIIPKNFDPIAVPRMMYHKACKDIITRMTKGWFPKFIVENWKELHSMTDDAWYKKAKQSLRDVVLVNI